MNWTLRCGDARHELQFMATGSANCVVTSPPYWGLRDYGHARQIGREASPIDFAAEIVGVFAEVRRVLRDDGVVWLNIGDTYNSAFGSGAGPSRARSDTRKQTDARLRGRIADIKPKDLIGVPWRVAFALQADGWYLRSDVIWAKPNPMPESVTDRPTKAHEYVFLLTKSERYAYNADAIRLPVTEAMLQQMAQGYEGEGRKDYESAGVQNPSDLKRRIIEKKRTPRFGVDGPGNLGKGGIPYDAVQGANARTVWQIPTEPSPYQHFAVMPKALARKCILAGCPVGGVVLDPFAGVATTGVVALEEGRSFVGIELSEKYYQMAHKRLSETMPLLARELSHEPTPSRPAGLEESDQCLDGSGLEPLDASASASVTPRRSSAGRQKSQTERRSACVVGGLSK